MFVQVLFVFPSLRAGDPDHLGPGALTPSIGKVSLVEDYFWVRYPYIDLIKVPKKKKKLSESVNQLAVSINDFRN